MAVEHRCSGFSGGINRTFNYGETMKTNFQDGDGQIEFRFKAIVEIFFNFFHRKLFPSFERDAVTTVTEEKTRNKSQLDTVKMRAFSSHYNIERNDDNHRAKLLSSYFFSELSLFYFSSSSFHQLWFLQFRTFWFHSFIGRFNFYTSSSSSSSFPVHSIKGFSYRSPGGGTVLIRKSENHRRTISICIITHYRRADFADGGE